MRKQASIVLCFIALILLEAALAEGRRFIPVEGPNLKSRLDAAIQLARSNPQPTRFWVAYAFDVRPGVAVDAEMINTNGARISFDGTSVSLGAPFETRNLGVFLLYEPSAGSIARVEVYNLDRQREYSGYPVYWLGRAANEESLGLLRGLVQFNPSSEIAKRSTMAIALHDDPRVASLLKEFVRSISVDKVRSTAVFWLGQIGGEQSFLAELVRNEQENTEVRKKAAFAIGMSKDRAALSTLQSVYGSVASPEVKKQILFAASVNENQDDAVNFLIKVASSDASREARKQALFWLAQKAGQRSLQALDDAANSSDADIEVQKHAVFAISRRPKEEAIPLLTKIAKTHPKAAVRKQAIFWLGQTGDERALEFFKELFSK